MLRNKRGCITSFLILCTLSSHVLAEPPFVLDDAEAAEYQTLYLYPYASFSSAAHTATVNAPALELEYGLITDTEVQLIAPITTYIPVTSHTPNQGKRQTGMGDITLAVKYIFLHEQSYVPQMAVDPLISIPTGSFKRNTGNGRSYYQLPIWLEKHVGPWITYGGAGFVYNTAPKQKNYGFGGITLERYVSSSLMLGGELYTQGASSATRQAPYQDTGAFTLIDMGISYDVTPDLALLVAIGHSIQGTPQWAGYVGFSYAIHQLSLFGLGDMHVRK